MRGRLTWGSVAMGLVVMMGMPVQAETIGAAVSLEQGVRFSAPDGSPVAVSAGTYRLETDGDDRLRLIADGLAGAHVLKAIPMTFDIPIDQPRALFIPDEPDVSHLVLALPSGKGYDARTWSEVRSRSVGEEPIAREKLNALLAALVGFSSPEGDVQSSTKPVEGAVGPIAEASRADNPMGKEVESRGGLPLLSRADEIRGADLSLLKVTGGYGGQQGNSNARLGYAAVVKNLSKEPAYNIRILLIVLGPDTWLQIGDYTSYWYSNNPSHTYSNVDPKPLCGKKKIQNYAALTCTLSSLGGGESASIHLGFYYTPSTQSRPLPAFAQVSSATPDPEPSNNRGFTTSYLTPGVWVGTPPAEFFADLEMSLAGTVDAASQQQVYQLTVANRGSVLAEDVTFTHMFTRPLPAPNLIRIDINGANTNCGAEGSMGGPAVITCKASAIPSGGATGATIRYLDPGSQSRTSTAQVISPVPDFTQYNNSATITVHGNRSKGPVSAPSPQSTIPPTTSSPPVMTPLPPSVAMGILKPAPLQLKPQTTAPTTQPSPAPYTGKYRVVINGVRANHETRDDMLQRDGKRDEVYVAAFVRLQSGPYTDPITERKSFQLHDHGFVKGMVHGDVNGIGNRIQAGTASDLGGIRSGDVVPGSYDPALPAGRPPSTTTFPLYVWEGTLDGGKILRIHPTLWEWDGQLGNYNHWTVTMTDAYVNHAATSDYSSTDQLLSQGNVMVIDNVWGHDHPIGMSYYYVNNDKSKLRVYEPIITLTQRKLEALFSSPSVIGGVPPVVIPIEFVDSGDGLEGNYTMYLRVEKVQ